MSFAIRNTISLIEDAILKWFFANITREARRVPCAVQGFDRLTTAKWLIAALAKAIRRWTTHGPRAVFAYNLILELKVRAFQRFTAFGTRKARWVPSLSFGKQIRSFNLFCTLAAYVSIQIGYIWSFFGGVLFTKWNSMFHFEKLPFSIVKVQATSTASQAGCMEDVLS